MRAVPPPLYYQNRCRHASSSHWGRHMLIQEEGTLVPWMQQCTDRTRVIEILLLTYL